MLHENREMFEALLAKAHNETGIREDVIEKDYDVLLTLSELASRQEAFPAYFKGGTALYKILGTERRFSEDIDLTIPLSDELSNNQKKKMLEGAALKLTSLPLDKADPDYSNKKGSVTAIYKYEPITQVVEDPL